MAPLGGGPSNLAVLRTQRESANSREFCLSVKKWRTDMKPDIKRSKSPKRVTDLRTETAKSVKGGKTCSCSCQTQNEKAATTLKTFTA